MTRPLLTDEEIDVMWIGNKGGLHDFAHAIAQLVGEKCAEICRDQYMRGGSLGAAEAERLIRAAMKGQG